MTPQPAPVTAALRKALPTLAVLLLPTTAALGCQDRPRRAVPLRRLQAEAAADRNEEADRPYHFGSQGPGDIFSNHTSHTNRLIPVYTVGNTVDLGRITGASSPYRDPAKVEALYGYRPEHTVDPEAEYGDQSGLYELQKAAVEAGVKHLFLVLYDGMDYETTRAAAIVRAGDPDVQPVDALPDREGLPVAVGSVVTSPTHAGAVLDLDAQSVTIRDGVLRGGYDPRFGGRAPGAEPERDAPGYLRGQSASEEELSELKRLGGVPHAVTDSAASAAEIASGVKSYNDSINVGPDGAFLTPLFHTLQAGGWKVGTVSSVPFNHASPAAMYARNVSRDDYQDLARDMLGLPNVATAHGAPSVPGLDVVIGTGYDQALDLPRLQKSQGKNAVAGNRYLADDDLEAIDKAGGGPYVVVTRAAGVEGSEALATAAAEAAKGGDRLFAFFGTKYGHLPFRTADGDYDPAAGFSGEAEEYTEADLDENPTLAEMTGAALAVLSSGDAPFALFVEAGDVDWALHDNNLDDGVGAEFAGEDAIAVILDWVEAHSDWDESALIVTSDHGHYLVIDDPEALAAAGRLDGTAAGR